MDEESNHEKEEQKVSKVQFFVDEEMEDPFKIDEEEADFYNTYLKKEMSTNCEEIDILDLNKNCDPLFYYRYLNFQWDNES